MRQNVISAKGKGWAQAITSGVPNGFRYMMDLELECGHVVHWATPPMSCRTQDTPSYPMWVDCKQCDIDGRRE
jgi:hypothetical protein